VGQFLVRRRSVPRDRGGTRCRDLEIVDRVGKRS
jgi:hypothetical protein